MSGIELPDLQDSFPPDARQVAYEFFDKHLRHEATAAK